MTNETNVGFRWHSPSCPLPGVEVSRCCDLGVKLGMVLRIETKRETLDIRVTPSGAIRIESRRKAPGAKIDGRRT